MSTLHVLLLFLATQLLPLWVDTILVVSYFDLFWSRDVYDARKKNDNGNACYGIGCSCAWGCSHSPLPLLNRHYMESTVVVEESAEEE